MAHITEYDRARAISEGKVIYLQTRLKWLVVKPKPAIGYLDEQRELALRLWFRPKPSVGR